MNLRRKSLKDTLPASNLNFTRMTSLAPSSSVATEVFPRPPSLAHTRNSRGELGTFVNPYVCPCETCVDFVAERSATKASESSAPTPTPASLTRASTETLGAGCAMPSLRSETGLGGAAAVPSLPTLRLCAVEEESLLLRISALRLELKERQDAVYDQVCRSHDEMAAQDAEWEELDRKIRAMEILLEAYGLQPE